MSDQSWKVIAPYNWKTPRDANAITALSAPTQSASGKFKTGNVTSGAGNTLTPTQPTAAVAPVLPTGPVATSSTQTVTAQQMQAMGLVDAQSTSAKALPASVGQNGGLTVTPPESLQATAPVAKDVILPDWIVQVDQNMVKKKDRPLCAVPGAAVSCSGLNPSDLDKVQLTVTWSQDMTSGEQETALEKYQEKVNHIANGKDKEGKPLYDEKRHGVTDEERKALNDLYQLSKAMEPGATNNRSGTKLTPQENLTFITAGGVCMSLSGDAQLTCLNGVVDLGKMTNQSGDKGFLNYLGDFTGPGNRPKYYAPVPSAGRPNTLPSGNWPPRPGAGGGGCTCGNQEIVDAANESLSGPYNTVFRTGFEGAPFYCERWTSQVMSTTSFSQEFGQHHARSAIKTGLNFKNSKTSSAWNDFGRYEDLQAGDIIYWNYGSGGSGHVGIYIGNDEVAGNNLVSYGKSKKTDARGVESIYSLGGKPSGFVRFGQGGCVCK